MTKTQKEPIQAKRGPSRVPKARNGPQRSSRPLPNPHHPSRIDHAQQALSDVVFVELPTVGDTFGAGDRIAVAESVKAASDIYAPVAGEITEVNQQLEEAPELLNESPYDLGWMVIFKPHHLNDEDLLEPDEYLETLEEVD